MSFWIIVFFRKQIISSFAWEDNLHLGSSGKNVVLQSIHYSILSGLGLALMRKYNGSCSPNLFQFNIKMP